MYTLIFKKNRSAKFDYALAEAKKLGAVYNGSQVVINIEDSELLLAFEKLKTLLLIVTNWKDTEATYNGSPVKPYVFLFDIWYTAGSCAMGCALSRDKKHCHLNNDLEGWGCKHLTSVARHLTGDGNYAKSNQFWYNYGKFTEDRTWKVDKAAIYEKLEKQVRTKHLHLCPFFNEFRVKELVHELPDTIDVDGVNFKPYTLPDYKQGEMRNIPVNIRHIRPASAELNLSYIKTKDVSLN